MSLECSNQQNGFHHEGNIDRFSTVSVTLKILDYDERKSIFIFLKHFQLYYGF